MGSAIDYAERVRAMLCESAAAPRDVGFGRADVRHGGEERGTDALRLP
jgi:hypothetical protein